MGDSFLKVVPLDPCGKPHVGSLYDRVRNVVEEACEEKQTTFAEAIGILDLVKMDMHKEINE